MLDFKKKFAVLGAGKSALAAASRLVKLGAEVFVSDKNQDSASTLQKLGVDFEVGGHSPKVLQCDYLVVSPGIPLSIPIIKEAQEKNIRILSEVELGYLLKPTKTKVIAVTGTNGKSTVVSLIKHILDMGVLKVGLAGNIGFPVTGYDLAQENFDYLILELSSFQLELLDSFKADIALLLNITPDHLDRYADFQEYAKVKKNIFRWQTKNDRAFTSNKLKEFESKAPLKFVENFLEGDKVIVGDSVFVNNNPKLLGQHNLQNIAFAVLATLDIVEAPLIQKAIKSFQPLKHRLEVCMGKDGVTYVNDSKATTVDSTLCALESFPQKVILILGGSDKGEDFSRLLYKLTERTKKVFLTGETGKKMLKIFKGKVNCEYLPNLESCVQESKKIAKTGDVVLLSPACASYDSFANFEERGEFFVSLAKDLG